MRLIPALCATLIAGCAVVTERYYLPTDAALVEGGTFCGSVPWGRASVPITPSISASVHIAPRDGRINLSMQLALPQGTQVRFIEPVLRLETPTSTKQYVAPLGPFQLSVYGRPGVAGHHEHFDPTAVLVGRGRNADLAGPDTQYVKYDLFISGSSVIAEPSETLVLTFPPVEVNGAVVGARTIPLHLINVSALMTCIQ